jgi:hypothetical protein
VLKRERLTANQEQLFKQAGKNAFGPDAHAQRALGEQRIDVLVD